MKKIALTLALVLLVSVLAACGGNSAPALTAPEGTTEELMNKLYENITVELPLMTMPVDLNDEFSLTTYLGVSSADGIVEASVSESMIGAQAYSVVLARANDAATAETLAQTMFDNIDPNKWICVCATEKQAVVCGDLVCFVMLSPEYGVTTDDIISAYTTVCGGQVGTVIK